MAWRGSCQDSQQSDQNRSSGEARLEADGQRVLEIIRSAPHGANGELPNMLMFGRNNSSRLPQVVEEARRRGGGPGSPQSTSHGERHASQDEVEGVHGQEEESEAQAAGGWR